MRCKSFICAQSIIADIFTKKITAFNILEDSTIISFPAAIQLMVYSAFEKESMGEPNSPDLSLSVSLNDKLINVPIKLNVNFRDENLIAKNIIGLGLLPIQSEGTLTFKISGALNFEYSIHLKTPSKEAKEVPPIPQG